VRVAASTSAPDPQPTTAKTEPIGDFALEGEAVLADITTLAVAELRLTPGTPVWTTVKATDVDGYAAEPDQPVPGPPI